jgi:hypothetical protein
MESNNMSEVNKNALSQNVRLKPSESSSHPRATNYTNVGVAQGIAYVDFGFIEPALLGGHCQDGKGWTSRTESVGEYARCAAGEGKGAGLKREYE